MLIRVAKVVAGAFMFGMSYVVMIGGCILMAAGIEQK